MIKEEFFFIMLLKYGYGFILLEDAFYSGKFLIVLTRVYDLT